MSIKLLLGIIAVLTLGGGVYYATQDKAAAPSNDDTSVSTSAVETADTKNFTGDGSLAALFANGQSVYCTFTSDDETGLSAGEFWYHQDQYRVESSYQQDGGTYVANVIGNQERNYIWGDSPAGEMAIVVANNTSADEPFAPDVDTTQGTQGFDLDSGVSYDCRPWTAQQSQFTPPEDIEFMDMQAMMESMIQGGSMQLPEGVTVPGSS